MANQDAPSASDCRRFWKWINGNEKLIRSYPTVLDVFTQIDERVRKLSLAIGWELGPASGGLAFVLSPNMNRDYLAMTRRICSFAPENLWLSALPARPAKPEPFRLELRNFGGDLVEVDATDWKIAVLLYQDGVREGLFIAPQPDLLEGIDGIEVAALLLQNSLGEEVALQIFDAWDVVGESHAPSHALEQARPVQDLLTLGQKRMHS